MKNAKPASAKNPRKAGGTSPQAAGLPIRQLKLVAVVALLFGIGTMLILTWEQMFPIPPEKLVEVAWTHECRCAHGWMNSLRSEGFVVRDYELEDLSARRRQWRVPDAAHGCHPASYMGYVLDGHVPGPVLSRLAREEPAAVALLQVSTANPEELRFELLAADGTSRAWP